MKVTQILRSKQIRKSRLLKPQQLRRHLTGGIQTLESRQLLAAAIFESPTIDQPVAAQISMLDSDPSRVMRIVNGQPTNDYEAVGIVNGQCSGTLIAPNVVLTAAHCVEGLESRGTFEVGGRTYTASRTVVHPEYQSRNIDLALMFLDQDVQGVTAYEINRTVPQVGQMLTLVGFGATGNGNSGHDGSFGLKHVGTTPIDEVTPSEILWDFDNNNESNTAPGDSGGPAFLTVNGQTVVAGVTSGGSRDDAGIGDNSNDIRVDAFADWIDAKIAENTEGGGGSTDGDNNEGDDAPVVDDGGFDDGPIDQDDPWAPWLDGDFDDGWGDDFWGEDDWDFDPTTEDGDWIWADDESWYSDEADGGYWEDDFGTQEGIGDAWFFAEDTGFAEPGLETDESFWGEDVGNGSDESIALEDQYDNEQFGAVDDLFGNDFEFGNDPFGHCDVDGDGGVDSMDALRILNFISRGSYGDRASVEAMPAFDTNGDNNVTASDVLRVLNYMNRQSDNGVTRSKAAEINFNYSYAVDVDSVMSAPTRKKR